MVGKANGSCVLAALPPNTIQKGARVAFCIKDATDWPAISLAKMPKWGWRLRFPQAREANSIIGTHQSSAMRSSLTLPLQW